MTDEAGMGEPREAVLAVAVAHDPRFTAVTFKKWRDAGLLPRPIGRPGRGRGRGKGAVYPAGTGGQLLRLLALRAEGGRFDPERARWLLWWEGWPIDPRSIRARLAATQDSWDQALENFRTAMDDSDVDDPLVLFTDSRLPYPLLGRTRQWAGAEEFATLAYLMLEVIGGRFAGWRDDPTAGEDVGSDARILWRAFGLEHARRAFPPEAGERFDQEIAGTLARFSELVGTEARRAALEAVSNSDLAAARDELRALLAIAREVLSAADVALGPKSSGRELIRLEGKAADDLLPGALLVWLALRRDPSYHQMYRVLTAVGSVAAMIRRALAGGEEPLR